MIRFGTDGLRGRAGERPIDRETARAIGRAVARIARQDGQDRVLVGRDTRPSGVALAAAVLGGVAAEGASALDAGVLPTSAVATALHGGFADAGVAVTASHNPAEDNGFKIFAAGGRKLDDGEERRLEALIDALQGGPAGEAEPVARHVGHEVLSAYFAALRDRLPARGRLAGRRLVLDLANGAATVAVDWLRAEVPAEWTVIGDGAGPINDGCGALHPEVLSAEIVSRGCSGGFAVDGDADRCVLVDERGEVVTGDALAWLLAMETRAASMAVTVLSSASLEACLPDVRVVRTDVGDRRLSEAMRVHGIPLGCEESGHVLFSDGLVAGDGLLTGIRALCLSLGVGRAISEAVGGFVPFPRRMAKVSVATMPPLDEIAALREACREGESALGEGGRVFLRYSGTEPLLRILVEGRDSAAVDEVAERVAAVATREIP